MSDFSSNFAEQQIFVRCLNVIKINRKTDRGVCPGPFKLFGYAAVQQNGSQPKILSRIFLKILRIELRSCEKKFT